MFLEGELDEMGMKEVVVFVDVNMIIGWWFFFGDIFVGNVLSGWVGWVCWIYLICLNCVLNIDDDFCIFVDKILDGVFFIFIVDCCYSGGLIVYCE